LWALTRPVPDDLTDFGEIFPVIVLTKTILLSLDITSLCAGVEMAQSEVITARIK
jgi:hypothetical protein